MRHHLQKYIKREAKAEEYWNQELNHYNSPIDVILISQLICTINMEYKMNILSITSDFWD